MKIAVPTGQGNRIEDHFGQCARYTVFDIDEQGKITGAEVLTSPHGCGCRSNIAEILQQKGVSIMLAGNMGAGALNVLQYYGMQVIRGCSGDVRQLVESYLAGQVADSGVSCHTHEAHHDHGGNGHSCSH
ncbi:MAG TPA: NifB/NifX family molybdenum-iron cluster-binding protein [Bacteroidales bacterium]|nr:NifB/NifX family molybdenum-iron cluster-binding protein [Bacteroidales bacterium]HSA44028.1 NifB/NifX family molybdenum-iron cluster-binding protein [Bacteroidales bacterium]